ncbi:helix-turn-helix transcriptional regulator [Streptomyces sp. NPDC054847]
MSPCAMRAVTLREQRSGRISHVRRSQLPAPEGYIWLDEASRLTGLAQRTLYNYRCQGTGPPSTTYRRKVVYRLVDVQAWIAEQLAPAPGAARLHERRPPEPRFTPRS